MIDLVYEPSGTGIENIWSKFISVMCTDGKNRKIIVDICGDIINRYPTKDELKCLKSHPSKIEIAKNKELLLEFLRYFKEKEQRTPKVEDFTNNPKYPSYATYQRIFGSWSNALNISGFVKSYKIFVTINEQNKFWIVYNNGKFIRNPTEEDLNYATERSYNQTNICSICREEWERDGKELTDKSILYPKNANHDVGKDWEQTEEWVCKSHYIRDWERYNPNSNNNIIKSMSNRRTGNLNDPTKILGDNCEELTKEWLGAKNLNEENDNYCSLLDHGPITKHILTTIGNKLVDLYGKIPQTKGANLSSTLKVVNKKDFGYEVWEFGGLENELDKEFDIVIIWCISADGESVERGYIIQKKKIEGIKSIMIYKNPIRVSKWDEDRIADKEALKKINDIWQKTINR